MAIRITDTLNNNAWRKFVDENCQGNIFHTPEMFQVFLRAKNYRPKLHAALSEDGQIKALLLPVEVTLRDNLPRRLTSRAIAYGSVLCSEDPCGKQALSELMHHYVKHSGNANLFTELRHLSDVSAYQPVLAQHGFQSQEHLNYLVDLTGSSEDVFNRIGPRTRKHIRRELKKGHVLIEEVQSRDHIKLVYATLKKTYGAAHVPIADISLFEAAFDVLYPRQMIKFWLAWAEDTPVACSVELVYKDVVYGWYGGVDRNYSRYTPNEVLTWHILNWSSENGYRVYDFGGAGSPAEEYGVRDFKAKFGGQLVCYGRSIYVPSPLLMRLSEWGYNYLRRFLA